MLNAAIAHEKAKRTMFTVLKREDDVYQLRSRMGRVLSLNLTFYKLAQLPDAGDRLYFSGHLAAGLAENLCWYQFSAEIGWPSAREPHDFLQNAEEFLIIEYADGVTVLLEEQYG